MKTIFSKFDLVTLDLDGLLVDTESLHFEAFKISCEAYGCKIGWSLTQYFQYAHLENEGLKRALNDEFPGLGLTPKKWVDLYDRKKNIYYELLSFKKIFLHAGAEKFLHHLDESKINRCVVTNSTQREIDNIKKQLPILELVPSWVTRELYKNAKPAPDPYLKAMSLFNNPIGRAVGLEDTYKGIISLKQAGVFPILVCSFEHPQLNKSDLKDVVHFTSLEEVMLF